MQIRLALRRHVEVDNVRDTRDVEPARGHIGRYEHAHPATANVLHCLLAIPLVGGGMKVRHRNLMMGEFRRDHLGRFVAVDEDHRAPCRQRVQ